jgi:DNA-directed RNA polymerase II subunit RPB1
MFAIEKEHFPSPGTIAAITYHLIGDNAINKASVEIKHQETYTGETPVEQGVVDLRMGTTNDNFVCSTCKNTKSTCPGHYGFIKLNYPVKNPMAAFAKHIPNWLKIICHNCGQIPIKIVPDSKNKFRQFVEKINSKMMSKEPKCVNCGEKLYKITIDKKKKLTYFRQQKGMPSETLSNDKILHIFNKITNNTLKELGIPASSHPSKLIINNLLIIPNTARPDNHANSQLNQHELTKLIRQIEKQNLIVGAQNTDSKTITDDKKKEELDKLFMEQTKLEQNIYDYIKGSSIKDAKETKSISEHMPGKQGFARAHLLGRRTGFVARGVISSHTNLKLYEVGVPIYIARIIQFPEEVQYFNRNRLLIHFHNKRKYPGATKIIKASDGITYGINSPLIKTLEIGDIIYRDIVDGDVVGFGRQPSLLPSSIGGFIVKIMHQGNTIRMNISVCVLFNADFDGDAMNLLFPSSQIAANELRMTSSVNNMTRSPQNAAFSLGAYQDCLIGSALISRESTMLNKFHAMKVLGSVDRELVFLSDDYTGRQIFSKLLPPINLKKTPTIYRKEYAQYIHYNPVDTEVEIKNGVIKSGIIDKATCGQGSKGSIYHIICQRYGPDKAMETIFDVQHLINDFLNYYGFTCGISDILLPEDVQRKIKSISASIRQSSLDVTSQLDQNLIFPPIGSTFYRYLEELHIESLRENDEYVKLVLAATDFYNNGLAQLIYAGSKGKPSNFVSISTSIGQQTIDDARAPKTCGNERTSPYFRRYDTLPEANGYISQSFREGVHPASYLFMAQEARHGITNNALSTAVSGEQNRNAVKTLEELLVDPQRRVMKKHQIIQLLYGDTGYDTRLSTKVRVPSIECSDKELEEMYYIPKNSISDLEFKQIQEDRNKYRDIFMKIEAHNPGRSLFDSSIDSPVDVRSVIRDIKMSYQNKNKLDVKTAYEKINKLCNNLQYRYFNKMQEEKIKTPIYIQTACSLMQIYIRSTLNLKYLINEDIDDYLLDIIIEEINIRFERSLISYGFAVGILAAQCISEPMTQFVLDSKHRSGIGGSKTNPIVRIKEILGVKSTDKMENPSMIIIPNQNIQTDKFKVQELANKIERVQLQRFVNVVQCFFEKYGDPIHPDFKHEHEMIKEFEKFNPGLTPSNLSPWVVRFELNLEQMIIKSITIENIVMSMKQYMKNIHLVYTKSTSNKPIIRCYFKNDVLRSISDISDQQDYIKTITNNILNIIVKGIDNIIRAKVSPILQTEIKEDGSLYKSQIYSIVTDGTNLRKIFELEEVDKLKTTTDSVVELYEMLGIHCAYKKIIYEFMNTMSGTSYIHASIYASMMTSTGILTDTTRVGMDKRDHQSILTRMSYQNPNKAIIDAMIGNYTETIDGISSTIVVGGVPNVGTTYSTVVINPQFIKKTIENLESEVDKL